MLGLGKVIRRSIRADMPVLCCPMLLGYAHLCHCGATPEDDDLRCKVDDVDDATNQLTLSSDSSMDNNSVAASVVSAVADLATGRLFVDLGTCIGGEMADMFSAACHKPEDEKVPSRAPVPSEIDFESNTSSSTDGAKSDAAISFITDNGQNNNGVADMTLTTPFISIRRSFGAVPQKHQSKVVEQEEKRPPTSASWQSDRKIAYSNALSTLKQKQAEALAEHHRLMETEKRSGASSTPFYPAPPPPPPTALPFTKPSVAEELLLESDDDTYYIHDEDNTIEACNKESSSTTSAPEFAEESSRDAESILMNMHQVHSSTVVGRDTPTSHPPNNSKADLSSMKTLKKMKKKLVPSFLKKNKRM